MKKLIIQYLLILALPAISMSVSADNSVVVIANTGNKDINLGREQVRNLFMGASLGYDLKPVALTRENRTRTIFNTQIIGLTESRIQSYWAQMKFTGRMTPPRELNDEEALLKYLVDNPGSVGYLSSTVSLPDSLTVLYEVK